MRVITAVPYRGDGGHRTRNWSIVRGQLVSLGWSLRAHPGPSGAFNRAAARNAAADCEWDVALFCDADIYLDDRGQARQAVEIAYETGAYTVAHSVLRYLDEPATALLKRRRNTRDLYFAEEAQTWESCFAVRRDIWDEVGGFDERFQGYGGQGIAFFCAVGTLGGRERVEGTAWHLFHPSVDRSQEVHFEENMKLCQRYLEAVDDPTAMKTILAESKAKGA